MQVVLLKFIFRYMYIFNIYIYYCKIIFIKVELVLNVERFLPDFIREKWIVKTERIFPNQTNNVFSLFLFNKATYKHIVEKVRFICLLLPITIK